MDELPPIDLRVFALPVPRLTLCLLLLALGVLGAVAWRPPARVYAMERRPVPQILLPLEPLCIGDACFDYACKHAFSPGVVLGSVSVVGRQEALQGASADGSTLLLQRAAADACVSGPDTTATLLADQRANASGYAIADITRLPALAAFARIETTLTVSPDGNSIIGAALDHRGFIVSTRSRRGALDFAAPTRGSFAHLDAALPKGAWIGWPVLSADGLAFYYKVQGSGHAEVDGTYESLRASTQVPFPPATRMPAEVQRWTAVTGVSSDRLTLFVTRDFGTQLLTRRSTSEPFTPSLWTPPPGSAYRVVPIAGCSALIGTCEPGGCLHEDICVWSAAR
jgi:hypothetical protein